MVAFNVGNVKATTLQDHCYFVTHEVVSRQAATSIIARATPEAPCDITHDDGGPTVSVAFYPRHSACRFRAFHTLADGAAFYLSFLTIRFSGAWSYVVAGDPEGFAAALKARGYFTAQLAPYASRLRSLFDEFDRIMPNDPEPLDVA